jgi:hypothetical protein
MILNLLILLSAIPNIFYLIINMTSNKKFLEESRKRSSQRNSETKCLSTFKESGVKLRSNSSYCSKIRNVNEKSYISQNNFKKEKGRRYSCYNTSAVFDINHSKILNMIMEERKTSESKRAKRCSVAVRFSTESSKIDLKRKSIIVSCQINEKRKSSSTGEIMKKDQIQPIIYFLNDVSSSRKSSNFNYNWRYMDFFHQNSSDLFFIDRKFCSNTFHNRVNSDCRRNFNIMKTNQKSKSDEIILNLTSNNFPRNSKLRTKNSKRLSYQSYFHNQ